MPGGAGCPGEAHPGAGGLRPPAPAGPLAIRATPSSCLISSWPGFLYSATSAGVALKKPSLPASKRARWPPLRNRSSITWKRARVLATHSNPALASGVSRRQRHPWPRPADSPPNWRRKKTARLADVRGREEAPHVVAPAHQLLRRCDQVVDGPAPVRGHGHPSGAGQVEVGVEDVGAVVTVGGEGEEAPAHAKGVQEGLEVGPGVELAVPLRQVVQGLEDALAGRVGAS